MKKIVTMLLVVVMVLGLFAACGSKTTDRDQGSHRSRCQRHHCSRRDRGSHGSKGGTRHHRDHGSPRHRQLPDEPEDLGR